MADTVDKIIAFEEGQLGTAETLELFASLIATGAAWNLQGSYGRTARDLIQAGLISPEGVITDPWIDTEID